MPLAPARVLTTASRVVVLLAAVTSLTLVDPSSANACSCAPPPPPETALHEADAVFTGSVTDVTDRGGRAVARLTVAAVHSGEVPGEIEVHTATDSAACGYGFEVGREELVYAVLDDEGRLLTNLCDRTAPVTDAADDLAALGEGRAPDATAPIVGDGPGWVPPAGIALLAVVTLATASVVARRRRTGDT